MVALRSCAGALADLSEGVTGPFGTPTTGTAPKKEAEIGAWPLKEAGKEEKPTTQEEGSASGEKPLRKKDPGAPKDKKKARRKEKVAKKKSPSPGGGKGSKKDKDDEEAEERGRGKDRGDRSPERGSKRKKRDSRSESRQRREDKRRDYREEDEDTRYLRIRGSVAEVIAAPPRRGTAPPEPVGSPPARKEWEDDYPRENWDRDREREQKPKKWKGFKHIARGQEYWKFGVRRK